MTTYTVKLATCPGCGQERMFKQHRPNHLMHALLTVFLGGIWLPVWLLAAFHPGAYRCTACGAKYVKPRRPWSPAFALFGVVVIVLIVLGLFRGFSSSESVRVPPAVKRGKEPAALPTTISAAALRDVFRDTPKTAEMRYADAELVVSGDAKLEPAENDGPSWLVFVGSDGSVLAKCAVAKKERAALVAHFEGADKKLIKIRCRLQQSAPDGAVTLQRPEVMK
jgi:hypothetical protein